MFNAFYRQQENGIWDYNELLLFAERAGEVVGEKATLWFSENQSMEKYSVDTIRACLAGWVRKDLDGAFEWLETEIELKYRNKYWGAALESVGNTDPNTAIELLEQLPVELRERYTDHLMAQIVRSVGIDEAERTFNGMVERARNKGELDGAYLTNLFTNFIDHKLVSIEGRPGEGGNIKDLASWLSESGHIAQPYVSEYLIEETVNDLAETDHMAALEWLDTIYSNYPKKDVVGYDLLVTQWAYKEGNSAVGDWLNNNINHPHYDRIARKHVQYLAKAGDGETAMQWIDNIHNEKLKAQALRYISINKQ